MKHFISAILLCFALHALGNQDSIMCYNMKLSINKGVQKFNSLNAKFKRADVAMIYNLLNLEFNISDTLPSSQTLVDSNTSLNESYFKLYNRYFHNRTQAINRDSLTVHSILYKSLDNIDSRTLWSFYCNKYPMPPDVFTYICSYLQKFSYDYTHAVLHVYNISENKCAPDTITKSMLQQSYRRLELMAHENLMSNFELDLKIECIALLAYMKQYNRIQKSDWQLLLDTQNEDGSWSASRNTLEPTPGNEHTTILALWALLEGHRHLQNVKK